MNVPFLNLKAQYQQIKTEVNAAFEDVLENTSFILGKYVKSFEENFANEHDVKYCAGLSTGTDGNHMALWALNLGPGDEVIIPANTFIATAWGATLCGAKPVFVDCESDSYNISPEKIEEKITPNTKAIVAVHLYGQPADMDKLKDIAEAKGLYLIEDAAQAHLAEYKGNKVGGLGISASFSFYPGKNLGAYGEAGAITTNDEELDSKFRMIREHGSKEKYNHEMYGHNYRMESLQGAVLNIKLKYLHEWTEKRRAVAKKYNELLSGIDEITLPQEMDYAKHVYHLYVIKTAGREKLNEFLNSEGIGTGYHYPIPLHLQPCFRHLGYQKGDFPVSEDLADNCLSLPIFPEMSDEQIDYVCEKIKNYYK